MFGENSATRVADVTDGMSNTIAMGETTLNVHNGTTPGWAYRGWVQVGIDPDAGVPINDWNYPCGGVCITPDPSCSNAPVACTQGPAVGTLGSWSWPGSLHPGGCHFLMGDGSVHFFSEGTAIALLGQLATMAGGEIVTVDE